MERLMSNNNSHGKSNNNSINDNSSTGSNTGNEGQLTSESAAMQQSRGNMTQQAHSNHVMIDYSRLVGLLAQQTVTGPLGLPGTLYSSALQQSGTQPDIHSRGAANVDTIDTTSLLQNVENRSGITIEQYWNGLINARTREPPNPAHRTAVNCPGSEIQGEREMRLEETAEQNRLIQALLSNHNNPTIRLGADNHITSSLVSLAAAHEGRNMMIQSVPRDQRASHQLPVWSYLDPSSAANIIGRGLPIELGVRRDQQSVEQEILRLTLLSLQNIPLGGFVGTGSQLGQALGPVYASSSLGAQALPTGPSNPVTNSQLTPRPGLPEDIVAGASHQYLLGLLANAYVGQNTSILHNIIDNSQTSGQPLPCSNVATAGSSDQGIQSETSTMREQPPRQQPMFHQNDPLATFCNGYQMRSDTSPLVTNEPASGITISHSSQIAPKNNFETNVTTDQSPSENTPPRAATGVDSQSEDGEETGHTSKNSTVKRKESNSVKGRIKCKTSTKADASRKRQKGDPGGKPVDQRRPYNSESFVQKLFRMVTDENAAGKTDVVEFLKEGGGFWLHQPDKICGLMPKYDFRGSKFSSFRRQLTSYGFRRDKKSGGDNAAFKNPLFVQGRPDLLKQIIREGQHDYSCHDTSSNEGNESLQS